MIMGGVYEKASVFISAGMPTILMTTVLIFVFKDKSKDKNEDKRKTINKNEEA